MILTPPTNYERHRVPAEEVGLYQEILPATSRARVSASPPLVHASHFAIKVQAEYVKQLFHRIAYSDSAIAIRECKTLFTNRFIIGSNYSKLYMYSIKRIIS